MHCCVFNTAVLHYRYMGCPLLTGLVGQELTGLVGQQHGWNAGLLRKVCVSARGLNLGDVSWRDCSEHIIRLINLLVQSLDILENYCALEQIWGEFAESLKAVVIFVTSVFMSFPHETARFTVDGLSWNLVFDYYGKIFRENSSWMKIWQD
jgi:hypothetical protein